MTDMAHKVHHHTARGPQPGLSTRLNMLGIDCEDILYRAPNIVMISIERIISGNRLVNLTLCQPCQPIFNRRGSLSRMIFRDAACDRIWSGLTRFTLPSSCQLFVWDFHPNEEISEEKKRVKTKRFSLIFIRTARVIDWSDKSSGAGFCFQSDA